MGSLRYLISITMISVSMLSFAASVYAWGPIAHYSIGKAAGYGDNVCTNLPDAWPSREYAVVISPWFAWTHAVQTMGMNGIVPKTPVYPDDGRYPGYDMYQIASKKIDNKTTEKVNSANGFIGHNAMDSNVHYTYFQGGSSNAWLIQHSEKEEWAEYIIYDKMTGGDFDSDGYPTTFYGVPIQRENPSQILIPCSANPEVIQLAQKAYRKNRRLTTANNDSGKFLEVDTIQVINDRITQLGLDMNDQIRKLRLSRYDELKGKADDKRNNWSVDEVKSLYEDAVGRAKSRIAGAGN